MLALNTKFKNVLITVGLLALTQGYSKDINQEFLSFICTGESQEVEKLIASGADINRENKYSLTPLSMAIGCNQTGIQKLLITYGADVNQISKNEMSSPLVAAIVSNSIDSVSLLLNNGADPNLGLNSDISPLFMALYKKNYEMVKHLINAGAVSGSIGEFGNSHYSFAKSNNAPQDILDLLV